MWKKIKKNWFIFLLILVALGLVLFKIMPVHKPEQEVVSQPIKKEADVVKSESQITLRFNTSQENVHGQLATRNEKIDQFFELPISLNLTQGQYTFYFHKHGYNSKRVILNLETDETLDISLEKKLLGVFDRIATEQNISSVGWKDNIILYQYENMLKEAIDSSVIAFFPTKNNFQISKNGATFTRTKQALYLVEKPPKVKSFTIQSRFLTVSPTSKKFAIVNNGLLTVYDINFNKLSQFKIGNETDSLTWLTKNYIGFLTNNDNLQTIHLLNLELGQIEEIPFEKGKINNFSLSPQENYINVDYQLGTTVYNLNQENIYNFTTSNGYKQSMSFWRNENELIIVEKYEEEFAPSHYRTLDNFWVVDPIKMNEYLITSSAPIANRIDFSISPKLSPDKNALIVAENNGPIWLLLLEGSIRTYMPDYKDIPIDEIPEQCSH